MRASWSELPKNSLNSPGNKAHNWYELYDPASKLIFKTEKSSRQKYWSKRLRIVTRAVQKSRVRYSFIEYSSIYTTFFNPKLIFIYHSERVAIKIEMVFKMVHKNTQWNTSNRLKVTHLTFWRRSCHGNYPAFRKIVTEKRHSANHLRSFSVILRKPLSARPAFGVIRHLALENSSRTKWSSFRVLRIYKNGQERGKERNNFGWLLFEVKRMKAERDRENFWGRRLPWFR